ncbi:type III-B CRISPR module RAMP protein Cmr6 [Runella zeae]|uniref:type III-B CRISPR module RAMP protein Cmr6 n=1 Tax=Runella zeae TaxID=94255 RepID=UPI000415EE7C|nr:type III-B CRISPR module RAMP protein Cmr6 [Runella zeae]
MKTNKNFGYLFGKDYYQGYFDQNRSEQQQKTFFDNKHQPFFKETFSFNNSAPAPDNEFDLTTRYPGLVLGTGYGHGVKGVTGDFKIGFSFDYTTGLPIIPGSSLKGTLRSVFPNEKGAHVHKNASDTIKDEKRKYIRTILKVADDFDVDALELEIFEGKVNGQYLPMSKHDVFLDAEIVKPNSKGLIFGDDYITPHVDTETRKPAPLKNPTPLRFLKILPNVTFRFSFELQDGLLISATQKLALFQQILLDLGIGAKTNVGYGRLKPSE